MRFLLLGDMHFYQLGLWPWQLLSKRLLGQTNLWLRRRKKFRPDLRPALVEKIQSLAPPDWFISTGDWTTTTLPHELTTAYQWLTQTANDVPIFTLPGNHDRYTFSAAARRDFEATFTDTTATQWPHYQRLTDHLHLIALDATRPNWLNASGHLPAIQLDALTARLQTIDPNDQLLIMCHYPIGTPHDQPDEAASHGLVNTDALVERLGQFGHRTLYLHGHIHRPWLYQHPVATNVTILNAGAPIMTTQSFPYGQGFWELQSPGTLLPKIPLGISEAAAPEMPPPSDWTFIHHHRDTTGHWQSQTIATPTTDLSTGPLSRT